MGNKWKILVVDDEEIILNLTQKILDNIGVDVLLADSGGSALDKFIKYHKKIALVIMDFTMDDLTGPETLRAMRKISPDKPGIFFSGRPLKLNDIPKDLRNTNIYLIQKPFRAAELLDLIEQINILDQSITPKIISVK